MTYLFKTPDIFSLFLFLILLTPGPGSDTTVPVGTEVPFPSDYAKNLFPKRLRKNIRSELRGLTPCLCINWVSTDLSSFTERSLYTLRLSRTHFGRPSVSNLDMNRDLRRRSTPGVSNAPSPRQTRHVRE